MKITITADPSEFGNPGCTGERSYRWSISNPFGSNFTGSGLTASASITVPKDEKGSFGAPFEFSGNCPTNYSSSAGFQGPRGQSGDWRIDPDAPPTETPPTETKPQTNCKKNGKRVLCADQKKAVKQGKGPAKKAGGLWKALVKAKSPKTPEQTSKLTDLVAEVCRYAVPVPTILVNWIELKLPTKASAARNTYRQPSLYALYDALRRLAKLRAEFCTRVRAAAEEYYATAEGKQALDQSAQEKFGSNYSNLDAEKKCDAAAPVIAKLSPATITKLTAKAIAAAKAARGA